MLGECSIPFLSGKCSILPSRPVPNLKRGILYSRCHSSETRHLACQVGGASADLFFINLKIIAMVFVKLYVALFVRDQICFQPTISLLC